MIVKFVVGVVFSVPVIIGGIVLTNVIASKAGAKKPIGQWGFMPPAGA